MTDIEKVASAMGWSRRAWYLNEYRSTEGTVMAIYEGHLTAEGTLALLNYYGAHLESAIAARKITTADAGDLLLRAMKSDAALIAAVLSETQG